MVDGKLEKMSQSNLSIETTGGKRKLDPDYYFVKDVKKLRQDEEQQKRKSTQGESIYNVFLSI